ncbi:hypothetical protein ACWGIV_15410 [Streptomyces sp. NPDC054844]
MSGAAGVGFPYAAAAVTTASVAIAARSDCLRPGRAHRGLWIAPAPVENSVTPASGGLYGNGNGNSHIRSNWQ